MASINISDLQPTGFDLFSDSESYMRELSSEEEVIFKGGNAVYVFIAGYLLEKAVDYMLNELYTAYKTATNDTQIAQGMCGVNMCCQ